MSGIAQVLFNQGYRVGGSDQAESETTRRLAQLGIEVAVGHAAKHVGHADVVVISSAVRSDNPEVLEAKKRSIPVIPRAEMLGELMRGKLGIAIAGSHGKTTTTTLLAHVMLAANEDPTVVIGGKVDAIGGNAKLGQGRWVVAEADESDGSFLHLPATFAIVTNIDNDHLDHFGTLERIEEAFVDFVGKLPFYGSAVVCADDQGVQRCLARFTKPVLTYGINTPQAHYVGSEIEIDANRSRFSVHFGKESLGQFELRMPGEHYVRNALAVVALAHSLGIDLSTIRKGLGAFDGVKRRFETKWVDSQKKQRVIDDYAHHPTEVAATLTAARKSWPDGRVLCVFQPHRYTRTRSCYEAFLHAFSGADLLWIVDIYPAGEDPIPGVDAKTLVRDLQLRNPKIKVAHLPEVEGSEKVIAKAMQPGDLVLTLGAGSITKFSTSLASFLSTKE